ncbi:MAG: hypothetical protein ABID61_05305, partial [Candidatus Micrarchaeota archaeon]
MEKLIKIAEENKTILCFGIDPDLRRIEKYIPNATAKDITAFFSEITDKLIAENAISAIKPNYAYFAQYGFDGLYALRDILNRYLNKTWVILDVKRGDIGKSSDAYA